MTPHNEYAPIVRRQEHLIYDELISIAVDPDEKFLRDLLCPGRINETIDIYHDNESNWQETMSNEDIPRDNKHVWPSSIEVPAWPYVSYNTLDFFIEFNPDRFPHKTYKQYCLDYCKRRRRWREEQEEII